MSKLIIGTMLNGKRCVFDLPSGIKDTEQMESLIYGYSFNPDHRPELYGQPKLLGLAGPMFNGYRHLENVSKKVAVIRYEIPSRNGTECQ